jgi:hypothetical protein
MRSKLFIILAVVTVLVGVGAQTASAAVPAAQLARFKAVEGPFSAADSKWATALSNLSGNATVAQVSKPSLAFIPALKAFDTGLKRVGFKGAGATDVATIVKLNGQLIGILSSVRSVKSFESQFSALDPKYFAVQQSFAKYLGIPTGDVII